MKTSCFRLQTAYFNVNWSSRYQDQIIIKTTFVGSEGGLISGNLVYKKFF